jgi:hypothetical protein
MGVPSLWREKYEKPMRTCYAPKSAGWDGHSPQPQKGARAKCSQLLFIRCLHAESSDGRFPLFLITAMSHPSHLRTAALLPSLLLYIIKLLEVVEAVVCLHQSTQPT